MLNKWQRNYILQVMGNDGQIHQFTYPLTMEFTVIRDCYASAQTGTFRIYNLGQQTRNAIYKDAYDYTVFRSLTVMAGYGQPPLPIIFNGNVKQAYSWREEGAVNYITEIQGYDYGLTMTTGTSTWTYISGQNAPSPLTDSFLIGKLVADLQVSPNNNGLTIGAISPGLNKVYPKYSVAGNTWDALNELIGSRANVYIDNGRLFCIQDGDVFTGDILTLDSSSGLLGTPKRADTFMQVDILFEPRILVGQQVNLNSASLPTGNDTFAFGNGLKKVIGVEHRGVISGAVNGKCKSLVSLILPPFGFNLLDANANV